MPRRWPACAQTARPRRCSTSTSTPVVRIGASVTSRRCVMRDRLTAAIATTSAAIALFSAVPAGAGGSVLGTGGALEVTQLLNHAELVRQVAQQAQMISNQISQYATMIQNLHRLPDEWVGQVTLPYRQVLGSLLQMKTAVDEVRTTSLHMEAVFSRRLSAMKHLDMTPQEYLDAELRLAQEWGGTYQDSLEADLDSLQRATDKAQSLKTLSDSIPAISGNVEGLQNLAAHSTMMAGELIEMRTSIQRQNALLAQEKRAQQQAAELQTQRNMRAIQELEQRRRRDAAFTGQRFKYPQWK